MIQLGGAAVYLSAPEVGLGKRESVPDVARNLSRWVDVVAARVFAHATLVEMAAHASVPVINALSDFEHPCQAVADFFTLWERGLDLAKLRLAWVGDGNNVCHSVILLASLCGTEVVVACPPGFEPHAAVLEACRALGGKIRLTTEAREAAEGADVIYTDTWISMGQEAGAGAPARGVPALPGERCADRLRPAGRAGHALPARSSRRGDHRRRPRRTAERDLRPGREPAPRPEGHHPTTARRLETARPGRHRAAADDRLGGRRVRGAIAVSPRERPE